MKNAPGVLLLLPLLGCVGVIDSPTSVATLPPPEVRRLTRAEVDATLTDALGQPQSISSVLAAEDSVQGYTEHVDLLVSTLFADQLDSATATLAAQVAPAQQQTLNCGDEAETDCVRRYLTTFAARAWRRPVTSDELDELVALYSAGRDGEDMQTGLALTLQGVFEASGFLYRTELGAEGAAGPSLDLTQSELAAELSYLATGGPPDDALRAAAAAGQLSDPKVRVDQLNRLLDTPAAAARLGLFTEQWLGLTNISAIQKDNNVFPDFTTSLRDDLATSARAFIASVMSNSKGSVPELLSADYTFANVAVATFLGSSQQPGAMFARITTTDLTRRGILTQPSLLATYAHPNEGAPTLRGKLVRTRLLCEDIPPPPPNVIASVGPISPDSTTRERSEAHANNPTCQSCHSLMDPIGFGLEGFDGFGAARTTESNKPIDDHGQINGSDIAGPFQGGVELSAKVSQSAQVGACATTQLMRFALGHRETALDTPTLDQAKKRYQEAGGSLYAAMAGLVESDAFVKRSVSP